MHPHHERPDGDRFSTFLEDGVVYVGAPGGRIEVGEADRIVELAGGPAWTIEYSERQKERYPDLDTSDEGLTVDVLDVTLASTHDRSFVETLRAQPADPPEGDGVAPRMGLFVGRLLTNLQYGID